MRKNKDIGGTSNFLTRLAENLLKLDVTDFMPQLVSRYETGCLQTPVWICAFSINQHASICGGFGPEPVGDPEAFAVFET